MRNTSLVGCAALALCLCGCAGLSQKQNVYQSTQLQHSMKVRLATVIDVRTVDIEARPGGAGAAAGASIGAIAATGLDSRGGLIAGIAGAVVGGLAGSLAEKVASAKTGVEITFQADGASDAEALVQELDDQVIAPGDRIRLIEGGGALRAVKIAARLVR